MNLKTLRPGLLVSLKTGTDGNAKYRRLDIEAGTITEEGAERARWETERTITDPAEHKRASEIRSQCRNMIYRICSSSTFGLLCPEDKKDELDAAVKQAQELAAEFNSTAAVTRVRIYVIAGRIAPDDVEAVRAINSEVRSLLSDMEQGIQNLDVKAVREAATKAKSIGRMLSTEAAERIKVAIEAAREVARKIVKAGEETAVAIDHAVVRKIAESRTMFLDLDDQEQGEVQAPAAEARAVDLEPELPLAKPTPQQPQLEV